MTNVKWRMFFDIVCPNSWISFKLLRSKKFTNIVSEVDFVPVCDVMLAIIRSGERRRTRRERNISKGENSAVGDESASEPRLLGNTEYFSKQIPAEGDYLPPIMWKETYSSALANGSIIPALFLCSVKQRLPEHFLRSVEVIGERIWDRRLPVCKGAHLSTCAREAGLTFLEAEEIISRLSHVDSKELLRRNSEEAVLLGASFAPLFVSSPEYSITFHNFHDFRTSLFNNRMNHSHTHIHKPK